MTRFVALLADQPDATERFASAVGHILAEPGWRRCDLGARGCLLVDDASAPLDLGQGLLVGRLFDRSARPVTTMAEQDRTAVIESRGDTLVERFWGGYVAFLTPEDDKPPSVLRDPSGALNCFIAVEEGVTVIASDAGLLAATGLVTIEIDWSGLADHLAFSQLRSPRTALAGIAELLPGLSWVHGDDPGEQRCRWSPWRFADPRGLITDGDEAARRLRSTVQQCVGAWGLAAGRIVLSLSGGLDSSIVAAALATAGADLSCFSYRTVERAGDERDYARAVAARLGCPLVEAELSADMVDLFRTDAADLARPTLKAFYQAADGLLLDLARDVGAGAFINGAGGDHVFCYLHSARPLVDRIRLEFNPLGWRQTARDISRLAECSAPSVWAAAWTRRRRDRVTYRWTPDRSWLSARWRDRPPFAHPWLNAPCQALPGSVAHVANILQAQNHLESARVAVLPVISPLMSQPVLETCLGIASYLWCEGGINRAVARRAFADRLPADVIGRRSKGTPHGLVAALYERHWPAIRERLLDGALAAQGMVDREALDAALRSEPTARGATHQDAMRLLDAELWVERWASRGRHPRATA